jgi:hypothetical protein
MTDRLLNGSRHLKESHQVTRSGILIGALGIPG